MTITLYKIYDDARSINKTLDNTTKIADLSSAHFKADVDILHPRLEIAYDPSYTGVNYVYIDDWKRYYFVRNISAGSQRIFLDCDVDVLQTYASEILDLQCVVARQEDENHSQLYLNDGMFRALQPKKIVTLGWGKHFDDDGSFVMAIGGES